MADSKVSALTAGIVPVAADLFPSVQSGASVKVTTSQIRQYVGAGLTNASTTTVSAGYAADTYLAGSTITIPVAGGWAVGSFVKWQFDMAKTAAGTAAPTVNVRMGTLGTTGDASVNSLALGAGTAAVDNGVFEVICIFRSVGAGTAATVLSYLRLSHSLAATGLTTTGASGWAGGGSVGAGFDSTTQTKIGLSFNGGASFSGTNIYVLAEAGKL